MKSSHLSLLSLIAIALLANACSDSNSTACSSTCSARDAYCDNNKSIYYVCVTDESGCNTLTPDKKHFKDYCSDECVSNCDPDQDKDTVHCKSNGTYNKCKTNADNCSQWTAVSKDYSTYCKSDTQAACTDECELNASQCDVDNKSWRICAYAGTDCLVWIDYPQIFDSKCSNAQSAHCTNECLLGDKTCDDQAKKAKECVSDADNCLIWKDVSAQFDAICSPSSDNSQVCESGTNKCDHDTKTFYTCQDVDGKPQWVANAEAYTTYCPGNDSGNTTSCRNLCSTENELNSDGTQICQMAENGCLAWTDNSNPTVSEPDDPTEPTEPTEPEANDDKEYILKDKVPPFANMSVAVHPDGEWYVLAWSVESKTSKAKIYAQRFQFPNTPLDAEPVEIFTTPNSYSFLSLDSFDISPAGNIAFGFSYLRTSSRQAGLIVTDSSLKKKYQRGVEKTYETVMLEMTVKFGPDEKLYSVWLHDSYPPVLALAVFKSPENYSGNNAKEASPESSNTLVDVSYGNDKDFSNVGSIASQIVNNTIYLTWSESHDYSNKFLEDVATATFDLNGNVINAPVADKFKYTGSRGSVDMNVLSSDRTAFVYNYPPANNKSAIKFKIYQNTALQQEIKIQPMTKGGMDHVSFCMDSNEKSILLWDEQVWPEGDDDNYGHIESNVYWTVIDKDAQKPQQINSTHINSQYAAKAFCSKDNQFYLFWNSCDSSSCNAMLRNVTSLTK